MQEEPLDLKAKDIREEIERIVRLLEDNEIKTGDIVYCSKECADVIFLNKPSKEVFEKYHSDKRSGIKYPPFPGDVKYKTLEGEIKEAPAPCIKRISKGSYFSEFVIKKRGGSLGGESDYLEYFARGLSFRVEKSKVKGGVLLRFYGDSQEEVDNFVTICCQNDFILW